MPFQLLPLQPADAAACVEIYFSAFAANTHSLACWPRTPGIRSFWTDMIREEISEPGAHWFKAVHTSSSSTSASTSHTAGNEAERIVAFAKWVGPRAEGELPGVELPEWPAEADGRLCDETFGDWAMKHRELMGGRRHWFLEIIATDPAYQGQGAGSQILKWGVQQADAAGMEAYLDAAPDAVGLYEKFGFREVTRTDTLIDNERVKQTWYRETFMIRPAAAASQGLTATI